MNVIELARNCASLGKIEDAQKAYILALNENDHQNPLIDIEGAVYLLQTGGDYKISYTFFVYLYNHGYCQNEIFDIMVQAFYEPNEEELGERFEQNCHILEEYPFYFRKDILNHMDDTSIFYFPYDEEGYVPFYKNENRFGDYVNPNKKKIEHYFFRNLDQPIFAEDIYSQYELEYLNDMVRNSEWIGRDNHIYLHYTNREAFLNALQILDFSSILEEKKMVILIEEEKDKYPIDFAAEYGIDYSKYQVKPLHIREFKKLIWHTQLSSHNGGDFFNEVLDEHPNLLIPFHSVLFDDLKEAFIETKDKLKTGKITLSNNVKRYTSGIDKLTDKDIFVALALDNASKVESNTRIVPALLYQPHFGNINFVVNISDNKATISSKEYEQIKIESILSEFKYIKTFTPMRRVTNSYAASIKFILTYEFNIGKRLALTSLSDRIINKGYYVDKKDRMYEDCILVRFEDGKLNPEATFRSLAEFLDIPYTESMTYCSGNGERNPESLKGNVLGFDTATVYRTYDEYANHAERYLIEYFLRDVMKAYGYDFIFYDGKEMDDETIIKMVNQCYTLFHLAYDKLIEIYKTKSLDYSDPETGRAGTIYDMIDRTFRIEKEEIINVLTKLNNSEITYVDAEGQPLKLMPLLHPKEEYLVQPLYH